MNKAQKRAREAAEALAIQALNFLATEPQRLSRFLALSGLAPESIRAAAAESGFLAGVLAHLGEDEALLLAFAAFVVIWREGLIGIGYSLTAIGIALALLAYPSYVALASYRLPWIYDITTDPIDPPRFEALARIRPRDANPVIYAGLSAAEQQRNAYPEIETLEQEATAQASYDAALAVVTKRKWNIVARRPPERGREGRIEAVATRTTTPAYAVFSTASPPWPN